MTDRELMQMALDALEEYKNVVTSGTDPNNFGGVVDGGEPARKAIIALRDRLTQPEPEPVAWVKFNQGEITHAELTDGSGCDFDLKSSGFVPLYTAPVRASDISQERVDETAKHKHEWIGLTDEERMEIRTHSIRNMGENFQETLCKAIEARLKEKNT